MRAFGNLEVETGSQRGLLLKEDNFARKKLADLRMVQNWLWRVWWLFGCSGGSGALKYCA